MSVTAIVVVALVSLVVIVASRFLVLRRSRTTLTPQEEGVVSKDVTSSKDKGDAFELCIATMLVDGGATLVEWRGDKFAPGIFPENNFHPDLLLRTGKNELFAVECKYRRSSWRGTVSWATPRQSESCFQYGVKNTLPVFVALGVGGRPSSPNRIFFFRHRGPDDWKATSNRDPAGKYRPRLYVGEELFGNPKRALHFNSGDLFVGDRNLTSQSTQEMS